MKEKETTKAFYNTTIPGDWEVMEIGEVCNKFLNGGTPSTHVEKYWNGKIPWITGADIVEQKISTIRKFISEQAVKESSTNVIPKGNLLLVTRTGVGKVTIAPFDVAISQDLTGLFLNEKLIDIEFAFYFFAGNENKLRQLNQGTSINGITRDVLRALKVTLPPIPEQKAITHIFSLMDLAISKNNLLITKKELQKKWLMQNLLTGKKRLRGFEGEWDEVKLGDIGKIKMCKRVFNHETKPEGDIPFYKIGTFGKIADAFIPKELYKEYKTRFSFPNRGDILISAAGTLGRTVVYDGSPAYFQDSNIVWIRHDESKTLNEYLFYVYKTIRYDSEGGTIQRLYNSIISNGKFNLPSIKEQTAIAKVLQAADKEIQLLKTKTEKLREQKKGMMQVLLTGKKRLM